MKLKNIVLCSSLMFLLTTVGAGKVEALGNQKSNVSIDYRNVEKDKEWTIRFNGIVDLQTVNKNSIYVLDSSNNKLNDIDFEFDGGDVVVVKNENSYIKGELYTLVIEDSLVNINGEPLSKGGKVYFKVESQKTGFNVKSVEVIGKKTLLLEFTEKIDKRAEVPLFYKIKSNNGENIDGTYENFNIEILEENSNFVRIDIKNNNYDVQDENLLFVSGELRSAEDEIFNDGDGYWEIIDNASINQKFDIEKVELLGNSVVSVKFNKRVNKFDADKEINFKLYSEYNQKKSISDAKYYGDCEVRLKLKEPIVQAGRYKLTVQNIKDFTGTGKIKEKVILFDVDEIGKMKLSYTAKTINKRTVELKFDEKIDKASAMRPSNYILTVNNSKNGGQVPQRIYFDEKTKDRVKLFFYSDLKYSGGYSLKVMRFVENSFGDLYDSDSVVPVNPSSKEYDFELEDVKRESKYIEVQFTSELSNDPNMIDKRKYELILDEGNGRQITIDCNGVEIVDSKSIKLRFDGMRDDEEYILYPPIIHGYFGESKNFESGIDISK